jgi:FkbM family methyltransferase
VLAFEPDPYNFRALEYNVRRSGCRSVALHRSGLAEAPRRAIFHLSRGTIGSSLARRTDTIGARKIELTTVDAELRGHRVAALLVKLNVESSEPLVLDGMRETFDRVRQITMFIELDPAKLRTWGADPRQLVERLEELGFRVSTIRLADQSLVPVEADRKGHLYCERP